MLLKKWVIVAVAVAAAAYAIVADEIVLAERGKPIEYTIVLPPEPSPVLEYAAEEFRDWTEKLTGVRLAVATNANPPKAVYVGGMTEAGLGTDGFRVRAEGKSIRILGSSESRGVLYGVYELLETYGGIGWFSSWHTVVPATGRFAIPDNLDDKQVPAFDWREPFSYDVNKHAAFAARIRRNNDWWWSALPVKMGGVFMKCCKRLRGHSFYALVPPDKHFDAHPEWFSEVKGTRLRANGQLCLTNRDMVRTAISNMLECVRSEPDCDYVVVAHNDWYNFCTCQACRAVDEAEGSPAGLELRFANELAEALEKEFPGKLVKTIAYQYTRKPPKLMRPRGNVFIDFAPIELDYSRPIDDNPDAATSAIRDDLRGWGRISSGCGLFVFDYVANFNHYMMPYPNIRSLKRNVKFFHDNNVRHLLEEGDHCGHHGDFSEMKTWLLSKWMWNPDLDEDTLIDRFIRGYYGENAAPFVRKYLDELHDISRKSGTRIKCMEDFNSDFITDEFVERSLKLWDAAILAAESDPAFAYNVRMGKMSVAYIALMRQGLRVNVSGIEYPDVHIRGLAQWMLETIKIAKEAGHPVSFAESGYKKGGKDGKLIARWKRLADSSTIMKPCDSAIVEAEEIFDVWGSFNTVLTDDPNASGGKAYRMPNLYSEDWIAYMPMSNFGYDKGAKYRIRVRVRAERKSGAPDGNLVKVGVEDNVSVTRKVSEADGRYVWLDFVEWAPSMKQTLYLAPGKFDKKKFAANPAYEFLWFDQVEISKIAVLH